MKVITQLIRHFWQRGALSASEVEYLLGHGFVRQRDLPGYEAPPEPVLPEPTGLATEHLPPTPLDAIEEVIVRRRSNRAAKGEPKTPLLTEKELCSRIRAEFDRRRKFLPALCKAVPRASRTTDWPDAVVHLRQCSEADFYRNLRDALLARRVTLGQVWQAVDIEPFHCVLSDQEVRGRLARAYSAMLVLQGSMTLGKHAWLLHNEEVTMLNNLRIVYQNCLTAVNKLYHREGRLLSRSLADSAPVLSWSFVLLHNAVRSAPDSPKPAREFVLKNTAPNDVWQQAWTGALGMDRQRVTKLLVECYCDADAQRDRNADGLTRELYCPTDWPKPKGNRAPKSTGPLKVAGNPLRPAVSGKETS